MRALVIDDSRAMRSILTGILEDLEFEVEQAADAEMAYEVLKADDGFNVALVDWNLPAMSGLELVKLVRQRQELAGLRLMMVTTETELARVREALEAGADEYIMKPFDKEMLLEKLNLLGIGL
ncbi:MAG: response regulator [Thermoanaerobaculales bacterium]|nr:response regulator [Thermoanaerobaculales bacterium]